AELLYARGARVVAEDINPDVERLAKPGLVPLIADVSKEDSATKAVALAVDSFGRLDILVNNAARIMSKLVVDMTRDDWESIMSVNVTGAFLHSRGDEGHDPQQEWRNSQHCVLCCLLRLPADRRLHIIEGRACTVDANACA